MTDLGSAPLPPVAADDHVRGADTAPTVIAYLDFECPHCAVARLRLQGLAIRLVVRHFPVRSRRPRSWAASCAAEAAHVQGRFWEMHDALFDDQGRLDDPHLWARAERLGLDVARFEADRRSDPVEARVRRDFEGGIRVGVTATPTLFVDGERHGGPPSPALLDRLASL